MCYQASASARFILAAISLLGFASSLHEKPPALALTGRSGMP